ncbi:MAG: AraC family transcriptional regulator [Vicinamibacterales bacterium]
MDVLTDVVESVRLHSAVHGRWEFSAPWGLIMDGWPAHACFYVMSRGSAWIDVEGVAAPVHVAGSDFVLLTKGQRHVIKDDPSSTPASAAVVLGSCSNRRHCQPGGVFEYGGGGARATLVSGCFALSSVDNPLIAALPPVVHVTGDQGPPRRWLEASLQFMSDEMTAGQIGAETVVGRLADILLVEAVRAHLAQRGDATRGWLRGLQDPQIGQALALMHERPGHSWTVGALASTIGMSRSAFAARFSALVGVPPLTYLTGWRMHRASRLLATGHLRIREIASQLGYDTESAFHKAFRRSTGVAPSVYRRTRMIVSESVREAS